MSDQGAGQFKDLACGSAAGFLGKLVEFPFDTVKVRLQTQSFERPQYYGVLDCIRKIAQGEGVRAFYQGLSSPLVGSVVENALIFYSYNQIQRGIRRLSGGEDDAPLTLPQLCAAGAAAGSVVSFVLTPVELIKCRLQVQTAASQQRYNGPISVIQDIFKRGGGLRGMYRGHSMTLARETAGGAAWFGVYEAWCELVGGEEGKDGVGPIALMAGGALAGMSYNAVLFPADVVKSRMQTEATQVTFKNMVTDMYKAEGLRGFYRGLGVTMIRSAPASAVIFLTYELLSRQL